MLSIDELIDMVVDCRNRGDESYVTQCLRELEQSGLPRAELKERLEQAGFPRLPIAEAGVA